MNTIEIKNKFDALLKKLSTERSFDVAEKISAELIGLLNIKTEDRFLVNLPRVDAELTRFQLAPGFARQAAAYELPHDDDKPVDLKLFWVKKTSKTNLSWLIGLTPNFEDAPSNDYKNMGIDFVVPEACDSVIVLLSYRFKVRALELKDHITPTQLEIFSQWAKLSEVEIADQNEFKNTLHIKLWESFNFEPINRKFYLELVEHFSILVHHLEKDLGRKPSVMFTTRLIGRLLFIWFLKKKNLVNNNIDYFSVPDSEKQDEYYKNQLEKLFFEILNIDELERSNGDKLTPYLNGGLFDKSTTDFYGDLKLTFPNGYFNQLFNTLNKYNFTVDESSPEFQHVAIDPEMLGRIFESLLAEQIDENTGNSKKKATGAFYTPREIVSYMCEQSLIEYLKIKVPETPDRDRRIDELVRMPEAIFRDQDQNKRRDWKPYREAIIKALEGSKTESPLTVLDPAVGSGAFPMGMLHLLVKVYSRLDSKFERDISGLKRDILSRSLYGVDIEQTAIEITRLRAWLSIIVDIPEGEKVEPLPNLEFKFVCANTLIPLDDSKQTTFFNDNDLKDKLIIIRNDYFRTSSKAKKEKLQKDYLKLTQSASLFDNKKTQQLKSYKPFDISSSSEFYDPELMHGVQAFDIVIGNPPYLSIRTGSFKKEWKKQYKENYELAVGQYDVYVLFIEKSNLLLKNLGILSFIIPKRMLSNESFENARKYILKYLPLKTYVDAQMPFESAKVEANIMVAQKGNNSAIIESYIYDITKQTLTYLFSIDTKYVEIMPFKIFPFILKENVLKLLVKIQKDNHSTLSDFVNITRGFECGYNDEAIVSFNTEYPFLKAESIKQYVIDKRDNLYCQPKFDNSSKYKTRDLFSTVPKIITKFVASELIFALDDIGYYNTNSVYNVLLKDKLISPEYLLAILNSKFCTFWFNTTYLNVDNLFPHIQKNQLDAIPIKKIAESGQRIFIDLVNQIITLKKQNKDADTKNLESQIDQLVYKLYNLTPEEIEILENSIK